MSIYSKWAQKEHGLGIRIAAGLLAGVVFVILLPYGVVTVGASLDRLIGLGRFEFGAGQYILAGLLLLVGLVFAYWSIVVQFTRGRGTPLPMLPTHELLTRGPFRYCRNPMTLGTILAYLGVAAAAGTAGGIGLVICFAALLVLYLKRLEEPELAERFGEPYLQYRREVPFIIPRLPLKRRPP
jgi:protein-S-isoprenylcysteine O-methyltransferase Ste14